MLFLKVSSMLYLRAVLLTVFLGTCLASVSWAQQMPLSFSLDWHGPLQGVMDSATSTPITPGDILRPAGGTVGFGAPIPDIVFTGGLLGLVNYNQCVGSGPGTQCGVEVDAMSYGRDFQISDDPNTPYRILFSVDEYSMGRSMPGPSIFSEAPKGDICADIITTFSMPVMPVSPTQAGLHVSMVDGNGLFSQGAAGGFVAPGLGAVEPNIPDTGFPNGPFDQGSHVDALDFGPVNNPDVDSIWFSVDSGFFDPRAGVPNSGTSVAQGVSGGDVLERQASGVLRIYAKATDLGLDGAGPDTDDLDVLILLENGIDGFQPSIKPFDWLPSGGTDMLLFSVRRGSAIIGKPDSIQGLPICEGDLLGPAPPGLTHQNPGIYIAAESMGLSTSRSGGGWDDDTSGADVEPLDGFLDCQPNGIEDAIDIASGSPDVNLNGIPDECEPPGSRYCFCDSTTAPCGNPDVDAGCANSTGVGARLDTTGSSSIFQDDLVLKTTNMPLNKFGMYFMGSGSASNVPVADGLRCVGGSWIRRFSALSTGSTGAFSMGPGMIDTIETQWGPGVISPGTTMYFQSWGRDVKQSPCGSGSNLSNGLAVTFTL
jgi:hypothetical protein